MNTENETTRKMIETKDTVGLTRERKTARRGIFESRESVTTIETGTGTDESIGMIVRSSPLVKASEPLSFTATTTQATTDPVEIAMARGITLAYKILCNRYINVYDVGTYVSVMWRCSYEAI